MVIKSNPVAIGSRVPQWPTFLIPSCRRTSATTSCEVIPPALSTSRTPSREAAKDVTRFLQNFFLHFGEGSFDSRTRGQNVAAAAKFLANRADIHFVTFRAHAHPHFAIGQFL